MQHKYAETVTEIPGKGEVKQGYIIPQWCSSNEQRLVVEDHQ